MMTKHNTLFDFGVARHTLRGRRIQKASASPPNPKNLGGAAAPPDPPAGLRSIWNQTSNYGLKLQIIDLNLQNE